jgi:hypothetical protein
MFVSLEFAASKAAPQLVVPSEAVIATGTRSVVIVSRGDAGFDVREVKTGAESEGKTVILSGLDEGDPIVLSGQFLIDSEASLKSTVSRLSPAEQNDDGSEHEGEQAPGHVHEQAPEEPSGHVHEQAPEEPSGHVHEQAPEEPSGHVHEQAPEPAPEHVHDHGKSPDHSGTHP